MMSYKGDLMNDANIVLIGFMGTGKTTIGKIVSKRLDRRFIDTDRYIEEKYDMPIKDIFKYYGEDYFRELERRVVEDISSYKKAVISTGGGIILQDCNIDKLKEKGIIFLLEGSIDTIQSNLQNSRHERPLLNEVCWTSKVKVLLNERNDRYKASADVIINIDNKSPNEISEEVISYISGK